MSNQFIQDGTGKGYLLRVDSSNRARVYAVSDSAYDNATGGGKGFNVNTQNLTPASSSETPVFALTNDGTKDIICEAWFFGVGGPQSGTAAANTPATIAVYPNAVAVTGGVDVPVVNRRANDATTLPLTAKKHDSGTPLLVNGSSTPSASDLGDPVLWQYQSNGVGARAFGVVHLVLPPGQTFVVAVELTGTLIAPIYTGFTGYIEESRD